MAIPAPSDIIRQSVSAFAPGGGSAVVASVSAAYTETTTTGEKIVFYDSSAGAFTITVPTPVGNTAKLRFKNKTSSTNPVTLSTAANSIDGATTAQMSRPYETIMLISDGTNWGVF